MIENYKIFEKSIIIKQLGLENYLYLLNKKNSTNIATDRDYQKQFNRFFIVRRNSNWQKAFYTYFESIKNDENVSFEQIIRYLYKTTGNIEASFSSKMLAIINPSMPIWDQYVLKNLGLTVTGRTKDEKLNNIIENYNNIIKIEKMYLLKPEVKRVIEEFKIKFSEYNLTDTKILDYILWSNRENGGDNVATIT